MDGNGKDKEFESFEEKEDQRQWFFASLLSLLKKYQEKLLLKNEEPEMKIKTNENFRKLFIAYYKTLRKESKKKYKNKDFINDRHKVASLVLMSVMKAEPFLAKDEADEIHVRKARFANAIIAYRVLKDTLVIFLCLEKQDKAVAAFEWIKDNQMFKKVPVIYGETNYDKETAKMIYFDHDKNGRKRNYELGNPSFLAYANIAFHLHSYLDQDKEMELKAHLDAL